MNTSTNDPAAIYNRLARQFGRPTVPPGSADPIEQATGARMVGDPDAPAATRISRERMADSIRETCAAEHLAAMTDAEIGRLYLAIAEHRGSC